jgi:hypothetical protein
MARPDTPEVPHRLYIPNSFQCPNVIVDELLPELSGSELKVLLYIVRRTFGFQRDSDNISLSQMLNGIRKSSGDVLDRGVGIKDKKTLLAALRTLSDKGLILTTRRSSVEKGNEPTAYQLNLHAASFAGKIPPPLAEKSPQGDGGEIPPSPWRENPPTQNPVEQNPGGKESNFRKANREGVVDITHNPPVSSSDVSRSEAAEYQTTYTHDDEETGSGEEQANGRNNRNQTHRKTGKAAGRGEDDERRQVLTDYLADFSREFADQAPLTSSVTRAYNLLLQSGLTIDAFIAKLYEARAVTKERSSTIKKGKMSYFFSVLADRLGLAEKSS